MITINGEALGFFEGPGGKRERLPAAQIRAVRSKTGMVFQQFNLWPHMTALGNVAEALKTVRKVPKAEAEARAMAQLKKVGLETAPAITRRSSPAASSSVSRSPARWRLSRRSCFSTSRPRRSTRN